MDMHLLAPIGIGLFYTLVMLSIIRLKPQGSRAVGIHTEVGEIHFALKEGHTIVGVMDNTRAMRFYIGTDGIEGTNYDERIPHLP